MNPRAATEALLPYLDAMLRENESVNLTAVRERDLAIVRHVEDSLAVAALGLAPRECLDLGTGNGFPGVALRVLFPQARLMLLERTQKKARAIERALHSVGWNDVRMLTLDAAQAPALEPGLRERFDLVTVRAVAPPREAASLAAPFLGRQGKLCLWLDAETEAPEVLAPRFRRVRVHEYHNGSGAEARIRRIALYELVPQPKRGAC